MITFLMVVGGLALFLYGVKMLSLGMEQLAGGKIQEWLDKATNKPLKAAAFGAGATAIIQSSGLLMVTMIGLINARLLTLEQAVGVMLGQEIGTTITGQIVAFNVGNIRFVAVALGFIMLEFGRDRKWQRYGEILLGFGVMFMGRELMAEAVKPMAANPVVAQWLALMGQTPILGVLAGTILTGIIQSSTATTGLVIAMGASGVITLPAAIGFIYGANIGSCITGFLASMRSSAPARRASIAQITINVLGVLLFLPFITPYASLLEHTSGSLARQIANAHTIFNVAVSAILFPFIKPLARFTELVVREKPQTEAPKVTQFIDDHLRGVPSIAIMEASKELDRMGLTALSMLELSQQAFTNKELDKATEVIRLEREVSDPLCDAIEHFVDGVIAEGLDSNERKRCFQLKNINVDLERVADHAENLAEATQDRVYHQVPFSDEAMQDLTRVFEHAKLSLTTSLAAFRKGDQELARQACRLEDDMDRITLDARQGHLRRVSAGTCHPEADVLFVEALRNLERIGDHADSIAASILRKS
jgi:phosphate:Na+ symporter